MSIDLLHISHSINIRCTGVGSNLDPKVYFMQSSMKIINVLTIICLKS
jgi:hypothetical protein